MDVERLQLRVEQYQTGSENNRKFEEEIAKLAAQKAEETETLRSEIRIQTK
jgi:hypothetical protein